MTYYNPDDFRISKSYVTMDIDDFIGIAMGMPEDKNTNNERMQFFVGKNHLFDDFEGQQANPYEEEAIEMAIRSGKLDQAVGRIVHAGPNAPGYEDARKQALRVGKPLVNLAAKNQNEINKGVWEEVSPPFDETGGDASDWPLNQNYINGESATLKEQTRDIDGTPRKGKAAFNPRKNGKIVTNLLSSSNTDRFGNGTFQEGWARWYHHGALKDNLVAQQHNKNGKVIDSQSYRIPAHYVHKNVMHLNDGPHTERAVNYVKSLQETYPEMGPDEIKRLLLNQDFMFRNSHHSFHNYDSLHNRINRKNDENREKRVGEAQRYDDNLDTGRDEVPINETNADGSIFHPESRIGELIGRGRASYPISSGKPDKKLIAHMKKYYDMEDEQAIQMLDDVFAGRKSNGHKYQGKNVKQRLANALYAHDMDRHGGNLPDDHHYTGPKFPIEGRGINPPAPIDNNTGEPRIDPTPVRNNPMGIPSNLPTVETENLPLNRVTGGHVPSPTLPVAPTNIPVIQRDPNIARLAYQGINGINTNIPSNVRNNNMGRGGADSYSDFPPSLASFFSKVRRQSGLPPLSKSVIQNYIEEVQLELAKSVIDDLHNIKKMDLTSQYDVAILASQVQRPSNDVISIYHTRGDWRDIAKSFGIEHRQVQLIKVALHE